MSDAALKDHVALVTGASSGIGRAIALALASSGASLCLIGRRSAALKEVSEQVAHQATRVMTYVIDVTRDEQVRELRQSLKRDWGGVDIIVHSAGIFSRGSIDSVAVEQLDEQYRTNVRAPYLLTGQLLPLLRPERGQVVFVNSSVALTSSPNVAAYGAMKHALKAFADALRAEVNVHGIRVLSMFVGRTATPMQQEIHGSEGKTYRPEDLLQPADVASMVVHALAIPRTAEVTDITIRPLKKP